MNNQMQNIQAVLFDLDGTLIDSVPAYFQLMAELLETVGLPPVPNTLVAEFMTTGLSVLEKMIPPEMAHRKNELIRQCITLGGHMSKEMFLNRIRLIPGVEQLFGLLVARKIPIGVVTSTERSNIRKKLLSLEREGIRDLLDVVIAIEDAPRKKPAPDPLLAGAQRLNVAPERCVYVGDSHIDIQAGRDAGMMTIGVLTGLDDSHRLQQEQPTLILKSVKEMCSFFS